MSSNNAVLLRISKDGEQIEVRDICVDTYPEYEGYLIGEARDLLSAMKIADKYVEENVVEYGIRFEKDILSFIGKELPTYEF